MKWKDVISDEPSQAHRQSVQKAVAQDLNANRHPKRPWAWIWAAALPTIGALFLSYRWINWEAPQEAVDADLDWLASQEIEELELLLDLELLEDLEVLERWEG